MENIIEVKDIYKKYNLYANQKNRFLEAISFGRRNLHSDFYALNGVSFEVKRGETVGLIGTNGSGKSTMLKIITGVLKPTSGSVTVNGRISALLELGAGFNPEYTGLENIYLNGRMMGYSKDEMKHRVPAIIEFADIGDFINQPVKSYSSGMFARLAFAVSINVDPDILIVDEALSVGDIFFQNKCYKKFEELKQKGVSILFVSHDISSVRQMCSRVLWIEKGHQKIFGKSDVVCDMYMDLKRGNLGDLMSKSVEYIQTESITTREVSEKRVYPMMKSYETKLVSDKFEVLSCFFVNKKGERVTHLSVDERYTLHMPILFHEDIHNIIAGYIMENAKGLPIYDLNNYISENKTVSGKAKEVSEIIFDFVMPRLMRGVYVVSIGISQGTQEQNIALTWLHGVEEVEIVNPGYNSSYIEIPSRIIVEQLPERNVSVR
ncbi:ABC transporter ATP-binding protein [Butyrivibrio fibrisolvens]|uniref:ABC transporter ATP-binding protein n=1 Tax=Butyrivibrio fibrisolvens TaxID=831 RepID=UPI00040E101D|nr:ABC transporter ATP-binding protein [Butyrivibrio fibrisolvens]